MSNKVSIKVNPRKVREIILDLLDNDITSELERDIEKSKWLLDGFCPGKNWKNYTTSAYYAYVSDLVTEIDHTHLNKLLDPSKLQEIGNRCIEKGRDNMAKNIVTDILRKERR